MSNGASSYKHWLSFGAVRRKIEQAVDRANRRAYVLSSNTVYTQLKKKIKKISVVMWSIARSTRIRVTRLRGFILSIYNVQTSHCEPGKQLIPKKLVEDSSNSFLGFAPITAQVSDKVYLLLGAEVPTLLRGVEDEFAVVGECYVHGLMNGEGLVAARDRADPDHDPSGT